MQIARNIQVLPRAYGILYTNRIGPMRKSHDPNSESRRRVILLCILYLYQPSRFIHVLMNTSQSAMIFV